MDIHPTYKKLLPHMKLPNNIKNQEGQARLLDLLGVSANLITWICTMFFSKDYGEEFDSILIRKAFTTILPFM